jgi:hypothetical protein
MHLVQLFLPLRDNAGAAFPPALFAAVRTELTDAFGGVTAYQRAPATGLWEDDSDTVRRDELVLFEVMVEALQRDWWHCYATELARRFRQDEILVRALPCEQLWVDTAPDR